MLSHHSINSPLLLRVMLLSILLADFVHVNTLLDLVELPFVFRSAIVDPLFPVIRTKEAFKLAFWVPVLCISPALPDTDVTSEPSH